MPPHQQVHAFVLLRLTFASHPDLKYLGDVLDDLVRLRNRASYDLRPRGVFASPAKAQQAVLDAVAALALLDQIDADPAARSAAIASIQP